jgi:small subunit ribosomal protein S16
MIRIRLSKIGKKHAASFRIVVGPENRTVEVLGTYNPQIKPAFFEIDKKRLGYWLTKGAKLTSAVEALIRGKYEFKPYVRREEEEKEAEAPKEEGKTETPASETPKGEDKKENKEEKNEEKTKETEESDKKGEAK